MGMIHYNYTRSWVNADGSQPQTGASKRRYEDVDDDGSGTIGYEEFLKMMTHKILNRDPKDETWRGAGPGTLTPDQRKIWLPVASCCRFVWVVQ